MRNIKVINQIIQVKETDKGFEYSHREQPNYMNEIGKVSSVNRKIETVQNIMRYYPFIELGMAIEKVKSEIAINREEQEKEYYAKIKGRGRSD